MSQNSTIEVDSCKISEPSGIIEDVDAVHNKIEKVTVKIDPKAEYYETKTLQRGMALIFNHFEFVGDLDDRRGTQKDCTDLANILKSLKFEVQVHNDLKKEEIESVLKKTSDMDHSKRDSLLVAVMSHGSKDVINARDDTYATETLWKNFTGDKCKSLAGKPKIFLIQTCRGDDKDGGVECDSQPLFKIPTMADILVMYSTYKGYTSFRDPEKGSWFIQSICAELAERADEEDFLSILTKANNRLGTQVVGAGEYQGKKQIGAILSTLTKKFMLSN